MLGLYEVAIFIVAAIGYVAYNKARKKRGLLPAQGAQTTEMLVIYSLLGILALGGVIGALYIKSGSAVKVCVGNEKTIETALNAYIAIVGSYPAVSNANVTVHVGTTAGTFSNPASATTDYLAQQPQDPVNPTADYTLTYVPSANTFTILCPGTHSAADLAQLPGTVTKGQVQDLNGTLSAI
jgi:hypothetical protein